MCDRRTPTPASPRPSSPNSKRVCSVVRPLHADGCEDGFLETLLAFAACIASWFSHSPARRGRVCPIRISLGCREIPSRPRLPPRRKQFAGEVRRRVQECLENRTFVFLLGSHRDGFCWPLAAAGKGGRSVLGWKELLWRFLASENRKRQIKRPSMRTRRQLRFR
jgi:hypothetical protein